MLEHPSADLGCTDGSNVHEHHSGGAAALFQSGEEGTMAHSMRVRETSPYPAELWALYLVLTFTKLDTPLIVLSDFTSALQKVAAIESGTCEFYSLTHACILRKKAQALRARQGPTYFAHIRAHVGFAGNEWADMGSHSFIPPPQGKHLNLGETSLSPFQAPHP